MGAVSFKRMVGVAAAVAMIAVGLVGCSDDDKGEYKIETMEYTQAGSHTFAFYEASSEFPAEIEIYLLGAGGGGQGGHKKTGILDNFEGTGGAGGGGAATYMRLSIERPTSFSITVGRGGIGGSSTLISLGGDWQSGSRGNNGENTSVRWGTTTIAAEGGNGGGGSGTIITGGTSGRPGSRPMGLLDWTAAAGGNGSGGSQSSDIASTGGNAARIRSGSIDFFGGGLGARRARGQDSNNVRSAERGGGGSGGYNNGPIGRSGGSAGGNGHAIIVVKYFARS